MSAPTRRPADRDPADVLPAQAYQPGWPVWVWVDEHWRRGLVMTEPGDGLVFVFYAGVPAEMLAYRHETRPADRGLAGRLPSGEGCAYAGRYGLDDWHEHDHTVCLDADVDDASHGADTGGGGER